MSTLVSVNHKHPSSSVNNLVLDASGNVTAGAALTVTGAATIGGVNAVAVAPGTSGNVLTSTGSAWASSAPAGGGQVRSQLFTASGTWTAPTGVTQVRALVKGSGGGSAGVGPCGASAGAGNGGFAYGVYTVVPGTAYTVTIGTAGAGATTNGAGTFGATGGTVSFGSFASATGGIGSQWDTNPGFSCGIGTGGTLRNSSTSSLAYTETIPYGLGPFSGLSRPSALSSTATIAFSVSGSFAAGSGGGSSGVATGIGGVNGIVYLEWVG